MGRQLGRRLGATLFLVVIAVGAFGLSRLLGHEGLEKAAKISEVVSMFLALAGLLVAPFGRIVRWLRGPQPPTAAEAADAIENLRAALTAALNADGSDVYEDQPMLVRFAPQAEDPAAHGSLDARSGGAPTPEQSHAGDFDSVVDAFSQRPRFRRVVLGEGGAGKTVLVTELQRQLLLMPRPGDPVPVIASAAAWLPDRRSLLDWLAEQPAGETDGRLPRTRGRLSPPARSCL